MSAIRLEAVEPQFAAQGTGLYKARVAGRRIKVGVTNEAWLHLVPRLAGKPLIEITDIDHPAHRVAQALIQKKYDEEGPDAGGAVIVTLPDLLERARDSG